MLDIGWSELVLIGVVALIFVGPKDLPEMFRTLGRLMARARMMARDFQRAMEDAADDAGLKDVSRDLNSLRNPMQSGLDAVNRKLDGWDERARAARAGATSPPPDAMVPEATMEEMAEIDLPEPPDLPPPAIARTVITPSASPAAPPPAPASAAPPVQETKV